MGLVRTSHGYRKLAVESVALGIGYAAVLIWIGSALVGSFGYDDEYPYWPAIPGLRTDTAGAIAFAFAIAVSVIAAIASALTGRPKVAGTVRPEPVGAGLAAVAGEGTFEPSELVVPEVAESVVESTTEVADKPGITG